MIDFYNYLQICYLRRSTIFEELNLKDYENTRSLFEGFNYQVVVRAVVEGTSPGKIWVNDVSNPTSGFMATTEGWFLAGAPENEEFNKNLRMLVHDMILNGKYYSPVNPDFLHELFFHIDSERWKTKFSYIFDIRPPLPSYRMHFVCRKVVLDWHKMIPTDYQIISVDSDFDIGLFECPPDVQEWISHSLEDQKKRGFGKCLIHGNKIVVWVNADCASKNECEIGIITTDDYRRKGLGSITAAATVDSCLSKGYSLIGWHCDNHNYGSIAVAEKVGFEKERDYVHYICMFDEAVHFAETGRRQFYSAKYDEAISSFNEAFRLGNASSWAYILTGRSYIGLGRHADASDYFLKAKSNGWSDWSWLLRNEEIKSKYTTEEWNDLLSKLL